MGNILVPVVQGLEILVLGWVALFLHVYHAEFLALINVHCAALEGEEGCEH